MLMLGVSVLLGSLGVAGEAAEQAASLMTNVSWHPNSICQFLTTLAIITLEHLPSSALPWDTA